MKIKENVKGNIKLTLTPEEYKALFKLLDETDYVSYKKKVPGEEDLLAYIWSEMGDFNNAQAW